MWEPSGYNLKLPDLCLGGPSGSSLISGQHLLWTTSRTLPIGHPVRGKPLYVLCVSNPHPTQKSWIPMSTAPSQECGVLKVMGCWGRKSPQTHFTLDRTEPRCSFPQDSREECEPLLCSPLFHTQPGAQGAKLLQSCPILCNPVDCSPPGSSVHGILQVRILEWVARPSLWT